MPPQYADCEFVDCEFADHSRRAGFRNIFLLLALAACFTATMDAQTKPPAQSKTPGGTTPRLRTDMLVSTDWLAQHLQDNNVIVLCIAGKPGSYASGHIPGARFIALGEIAVTRDGVPNELPPIGDLKRVFEAAGIADSSRIILYGERYGLFASRAYFTLDYMGLGDRTALLDGGLEKWKAENRPVSTEVPKPASGKLTTKPNEAIALTVQDMQDLVATKADSAAIIDARPTDEFTGVKISEEVTKAGHIPHSVGLYWMKNLESTTNPVLLPESDLRRMYSGLGAAAGKKVVTYCRSGMQSSFDYFVAKYLGYDAQMYDGSFFEWSKKDLPVESEAKK
jgi:thiosulfate/3-mercaptopyruvate sulfurtransferase